MNENKAESASKGENEHEESLKRGGSFRKILAGNSGGNSQLNTSMKMIDRRNVSQNTSEYIVYLQEYSILAEYNMLQTQELKGIYVIPSAQNSFMWFGVLFVRQGIFQGGVFRLTINLPEVFPDGGCPKVTFQTKVFHPLVDPNSGEFNCTAGFPQWKKTNRIFQLLQFITKAFNKVDPKMPAYNKEASLLLENNSEEFRIRAKQCVRESLDHVYDSPDVEDAHYIRFSQWEPKIHEPIRKRIYEKNQQVEKTAKGFSWVQPGSFQPLSKHDDPT